MRYTVTPFTARSGAYGARSVEVAKTRIAAALRELQKQQSERIEFAVLTVGTQIAGVAIRGNVGWSVRVTSSPSLLSRS